MPKDVVLGEGRMGEALLQAYPGQYRDAASESNNFDASAINIGQPGADCGRPMAVGDPDMPMNDLQEREIPGVGKVVVPVSPYDVQIPAPPRLPAGPPVMRYNVDRSTSLVPSMRGLNSVTNYPQDMASISPFPQDIAGVTNYPQDIAGLGETESEKSAMREYYNAMFVRGLEIAENVKAVADQWAAMQSIKATSKQNATNLILQGVPGQDDAMVGTYLAPALAKIDDLFLDPEDKLMDMAALQGWIEGNLTANVVPTMQKIQVSLGLGYVGSSKAEGILASVGMGRPAANLYAENWLLTVFEAVSTYLRTVAPQLMAAKTDMARQAKMAGIVQNEINKSAPEMMAKLGMTQDEVNQAMKQIGLGNPIVFLVVLAVVLAIGMTAAGAAAVYYRGVAKAACDVGVAGVKKIDAAWRAEYQTLLDKATSGASPEELNATAEGAGQRMTVLTNAVANDIRNAKPGDLGIGAYLVTGALVLAGAVIAGKYFGFI